jgi:hypothetical protein
MYLILLALYCMTIVPKTVVPTSAVYKRGKEVIFIEAVFLKHMYAPACYPNMRKMEGRIHPPQVSPVKSTDIRIDGF